MLVDDSASCKDVADVITPQNNVSNTFQNALALVSIWFEKGQRCQEKHFSGHDFHRCYQYCWHSPAPSLCWHKHQVTELFLNQLMFLLPLAHEKCYAVLMLPLAFFLWKGRVESQEQGTATQGQLRTQISALTRLCPLVPTSADISRKKCRKITNFQWHLTSTKTSDVVLQIILSFILCHILKYDNMKWNMKSENDKALTGHVLLMSKPSSFCTLQGFLITPDSLVFLPTSFLL